MVKTAVMAAKVRLPDWRSLEAAASSTAGVRGRPTHESMPARGFQVSPDHLNPKLLPALEPHLAAFFADFVSHHATRNM
jgi:hypothetical protein